MKQIIHNEWQEILEPEFQTAYYLQLRKFLKQEYQNETVFPNIHAIWNAFELTPYNDVKVVIIGQDPYHQVNQAMGMAFSVQRGVKIPPSLLNIYKELNNDLGIAIPNHGDLTNWAKQGVLLLNTVMSVEDSNANCHQNKGWEIFSDHIMDVLNESEQPIVFLLWGKPAQSKAKRITNKKHLLLKSVHPSPLSAYRGFFGSKPFSQANAFLNKNHRGAIDWRVDNEI